VFDFEKPNSQDLTETISTLSHLSRFIIADLTNPACTPHELYAFIPHRMVPVQSLFYESEEAEPPYAMFQDLKKKYHCILPTFRYKDLEHLIASLEKHVMAPAEREAQEYEK
jgi:hypothetical protein